MTSLFPNTVEPLSAPFTRQQFLALSHLCQLTVFAPIPWFPAAALFSRWSVAGRLTTVARAGNVDGLRISHPRIMHIPRYARGLSGLLYACSLLPHLLEYRGRVDVLLALWAYPDGTAAVILGRLLRVPVVIMVLGSDLNVVAHLAGPRRNLKWTMPRATRVVAVSQSLASAAIGLGARPERVAVVPNGLDKSLFYPQPRNSACTSLGLDPSTQHILYVGRLDPAKGVLDLLQAFSVLVSQRSEIALVVVGDGPARSACETFAARMGNRVVLAGAQPLTRIPLFLAASNLLVLPSWNEGSPNVVREALACGRPVVATLVGGLPELITDPCLGELVPAHSPSALAAAIDRVLRMRVDPGQIAGVAGSIDWLESARLLYGTLEAAIRDGAGS